MSNKTLKILIISAAVLVVVALCGAVAAFMLVRQESSRENVTTEPTASTHAPEEYTYDEDGNITSIIYYDNNVYNGRTDYYTDPSTGTEYVMTFDVDDNEIASEKTTHNADGTVALHEEKKNGKKTLSVEYNYFDDTSKLKKKTTKEYDEDGTEKAEKLYYHENGKVSRRCNYINGEMTDQTFYDTDGKEYTPESQN